MPPIPRRLDMAPGTSPVGRGVHCATAIVGSKPKPAAKNAKVQWLTTAEAATYLGKTTKAMQMMRYQHTGPAYQRNGNSVMFDILPALKDGDS